MTMSIDLPPPLADELAAGAEREGVSASEQATLLLHLATALSGEGRNTPFRSGVRAFLKRNQLDADLVAAVCEGLMALCLHDEGHPAIPFDPSAANPAGRANSRDARTLLREWRSPDVHRSITEDLAVSTHELPPLGVLIQRSGRMRRASIMGKYASLRTSSDDYAIEKGREIASEDRR